MPTPTYEATISASLERSQFHFYSPLRCHPHLMLRTAGQSCQPQLSAGPLGLCDLCPIGEPPQSYLQGGPTALHQVQQTGHNLLMQEEGSF